MVNAVRVKGTSTPNERVDLIPLGEQQLGQIRTVLARDTRYERTLWHKYLRYIVSPV
jgi:hypothetical protein